MDTQVEELYNSIKEVLKTESKALIQNINNQDQGVLIFNEIEPQIEEFKHMLGYSSLDALSQLPKSRFNELRTRTDPILKKIKEIQELQKNPNQADQAQKQPIIQWFTGENDFFNTAKPIIWQIIIESLTLKNQSTLNESDLNKKLDSIKTIENSAQGIADDLNEILNSAKIELSKGGVSKHAEIFREAADTHSQKAESWRKISTALIVANAILALGMYFLIVFKITDVTNKIEAGILTAILISFVSYGIVQSVRNYFAEKHNQQINQHKANCLSTYNTFISAADEDTKTAVLNYATHTIFSHQNTGYLSKEASTQNPNPIVEVIKNIPKSGSV